MFERRLKENGEALITTVVRTSIKREDARTFTFTQIEELIKGKLKIIDSIIYKDGGTFKVCLHLRKQYE